MQKKKVGNSLQIIRSVYNPEKKRSEPEYIGSQPYYQLHLEDSIRAKLEGDELIEMEEYFLERREKSKETLNKMALKDITSHLAEASKSLEAGFAPSDEDGAAAIYAAMDNLAKQLKRAGYPKSRVMPKTKKVESKDSRQADVLSET